MGNWANASCSEGTHKIIPIPSVSFFHAQPFMFWVLLLVRSLSERSSEVIPGHEGSQYVCLTITRHKLKIEKRNWQHCVCLVKTRRLWHNGINSFDLGSNFQLYLLGHHVCLLSCLDAGNMMPSKLFAYREYVRSYLENSIFAKKRWFGL